MRFLTNSRWKSRAKKIANIVRRKPKKEEDTIAEDPVPKTVDLPEVSPTDENEKKREEKLSWGEKASVKIRRFTAYCISFFYTDAFKFGVKVALAV